MLATFVLFSSCGLMKICIESPGDMANAYKYTDWHPLAAEGLKHLMIKIFPKKRTE